MEEDYKDGHEKILHGHVGVPAHDQMDWSSWSLTLEQL